MRKRIALAAILTIMPSVAFPLGLRVDMQNLNLEFEFASMKLPWGTLVHQYLSRTTYKNSLGAGWCNAIHVPYGDSDVHIPIETKAVVTSSTVTIEECGTDAQIADTYFFQLEFEDAKEQKATDDLKALSARLGRPLKLQSTTGNRITLTVNPEGIVFNRFHGDETAMHYDWEGQLTQVGAIKVETQGNKVKSLAGPGGSVRFTYNGDKLTSIKSDKKYVANFIYADDGSLSKIDNAWAKTYAFEFNEQRNLQMVRWPDESQVTAFYDDAKDTVTTIMDRDGCTEAYSYISGQDNDNYKVQAVRTCNGEQMAERTVTYHFNGDDVSSDVNDVTPGKDKSQLKAFYGNP